VRTNDFRVDSRPEFRCANGDERTELENNRRTQHFTTFKITE